MTILHLSLFPTSGAPQREVYFMGLIDVLTQYDTKKKAAHAAKTVKHGVSENEGGLVRVCPIRYHLDSEC